MALKWIRLYHSILHSRKIRALPEPAQLDFFLLLCAAGEYRETSGHNSGAIGMDIKAAAEHLRRPALETSINLLITCGALRKGKRGSLWISNWERLQFASDDAAQRVSNWRKNQQHTKNERNSNVTATYKQRPKILQTTDNRTGIGPAVSTSTIEPAHATETATARFETSNTPQPNPQPKPASKGNGGEKWDWSSPVWVNATARLVEVQQRPQEPFEQFADRVREALNGRLRQAIGQSGNK